MTAVVLLPSLPPSIRARCEATIERLIAFLDQFEPDTDLEDDGEAGRPTTLEDMNPFDSPDSEPSIGATAAVDQTDWGGFVHHGEQDCELDTADAEPSLGAPEQHTSSIFFQDGAWHTLPPDQTRWAGGVTDEREGDLADTADDREGGDVLDDGEETLGWCEHISQRALGPNTADGDNTALERHGPGFATV